jgi:hypothetical protein
MNLPRYSELGEERRDKPCQEYSGEWLVFIPDSLGKHWTRFWFSRVRTSLGHSFHTFDEAVTIGRSFLTYLEENKVVYVPTSIRVGWHSSDNDPRVGQTWFREIYVHGHFNAFGDYREV